MAMNFMKIDQVVMSGDGFYQSMAYHAYQSLPLASFALQCVLCVLSIAGLPLDLGRFMFTTQSKSWGLLWWRFWCSLVYLARPG